MDTLSKPLDIDMIAIQQNQARSNLQRAKFSKTISPEKVDAVAHEFEAQFISQMLGNMFDTVDTKDAFGGSESEEIYRSMLVDEYGTLISRAGGIGVADHVKREILKLQEVK